MPRLPPLTAAQQALFDEGSIWVETVLRSHFRRHLGAELENDLWQAGKLGLLQAARTYDSQRGVKWISYAVTVIRREMAHAARLSKLVPRKQWMSNRSKINSPNRERMVEQATAMEQATISPLDGLADKLEIPSPEYYHSDFETLIARVLPEDLPYLQGHMEGKTYVEIGQEFGVTRQRVHQRVMRAIWMMRGEPEESFRKMAKRRKGT